MINLQFKPIEQQSLNIRDKQVLDVCEGMQTLYKAVGYRPPWIGYLALDKDGICIGTCAFKSPPKNGRVEIAYFTFPEFEGRGFATSMATYLLSVAQNTEPTVQVFAQTQAMENASNHLLKKIGFEFKGQIQHPEDGVVWEWVIAKPVK